MRSGKKEVTRTTIKEELIRYARGCISGRTPSGKKHRWACRRLLRDFERIGEADFPYIWDEGEAQKIADWFALLRHSKGVLAGQPIILTSWQKFILCQLYGWRHKDTGRRRFTIGFIEVGRKNAKSQMLGGVALYECGVISTKNGEVCECYTAGTKRDQSMIILQECINMLKGSPLQSRFKISRTRVEHRKTRSFIRALSKEDGQRGDGTNPALLCLDEYHQHQTTEFYDLGLGGNTKEPLLLIITTAGMDLNVPCYTQEYQLCSNILNPDVDIENDVYFCDICEIDDGDDPGDERCWLKANPIRGSYPEGVKKIREAYEVARTVPEKMPAFLTKVLNRWVQAQENGYMEMDKWKACEAAGFPESWDGAECYVGFDMSAKIDLTSIAVVVPVMTDGRVVYWIHSHSFVPSREKLLERRSKDKAPYDVWAQEGYITVTDTPIVDQEAVLRYVQDYLSAHHLKAVSYCFDPANASKLMMELDKDGYDVEEVYQSVKSLNEATQGFREQVYSGNVRYERNPVLNFAMANAVVRSNGGLIKIDKDLARKRIDPVDAVLCAFKLAMYHDFGLQAFDLQKWLAEDW